MRDPSKEHRQSAVSRRTALLLAVTLLCACRCGPRRCGFPTSSPCRCEADHPTDTVSCIAVCRAAPSSRCWASIRAAEYTHVRTGGGLEGWISSQYLSSSPSRRYNSSTANNRIQALERQLAQRGEALTELKSTSSEAASNGDRLAAQVAQLEAELADVKQVSAGALEEHARSSGTRQSEHAIARRGGRPHRRVAAAREQHRAEAGC